MVQVARIQNQDGLLRPRKMKVPSSQSWKRFASVGILGCCLLALAIVFSVTTLRRWDNRRTAARRLLDDESRGSSYSKEVVSLQGNIIARRAEDTSGAAHQRVELEEQHIDNKFLPLVSRNPLLSTRYNDDQYSGSKRRADTARAYQYRKYQEILDFFVNLEKQYPDLVQTWDALEKYPDVADKNSWAKCGTAVCKLC